MGWAVQLITVVGALFIQSQPAVSYVQSLPPAVNQAQLTCHDQTWEKSNLIAVENGLVHKKLSPFTVKLLEDSHAQGVNMAINVAYRDCNYQLKLRTANCGTGDYNLYQKPSNLCMPPTEPAGKSMHNEGLAIDFACSGYGLFEYSPCLTWLKRYGANYHFHNHSIEAWHWSTTGI